MLATAGLLHLARPAPFDAIVPPALPGPARAYTYASGLAEIAIAGLLITPRTRSVGGAAATGLFVAVYPANVQMAWDWRHRGTKAQAITTGRLPLQGLLIWASERVRRGAAIHVAT